ncbi:MAG: ADP-ribosylglycohydrolase family protein, partial [Eudoraea sp.]|nr:ADP-ribosylglycohydrolase family protein [Eudoraea sp.]
MKNWSIALVLVLATLSFSCREQLPELQIPEPVKLSYGSDTLKLTKTEYHDKVLGALVGSAIGDAMGASTEMWHRKDIQRQYGYIIGLTAATRVQSPEGTWEHNLNAGATTDDTRWKLLMGKYFVHHKTSRNATVFAQYITNYYQSVASELGNKDIVFQPDALDARLEQVDWIKEWARVALAYQQGTEEYLNAQHRFYGGEMSCAGMLYTPMFGLVSPNPEAAYKEAYNHTLFDLGYGRDIAALVSGLTNMALQTKNIDSILNTAIFIDPMRYQDSRLVGRIATDIAKASRKIVWLSRELEIDDEVDLKDSLGIIKPIGYIGDNTQWLQQNFVYAQ